MSVWDFDCALTKIHLTKTYDSFKHESWFEVWGKKFVEWYIGLRYNDTLENKKFIFNYKIPLNPVSEQNTTEPKGYFGSITGMFSS